MSVMIEYLDQKKATIDAMRDDYDQQWKVENDPKRIRELDKSVTALQGISIASVHVQGGESSREDKICEVIDKKTVIEYGYRRAVAYNNEFGPCWDRLTDDERFLLEYRFINHLDGGGIKHIMEKHHISKTEAYRRSDQALQRLAKLLFW